MVRGGWNEGIMQKNKAQPFTEFLIQWTRFTMTMFFSKHFDVKLNENTF